jgi:hypothetical protein
MSSDNKGLTISVGKGDRKQIIQTSGPTIKVQGRTVSPTSGRGIDLVFVIDTTGSMSDKIEGLLATCQRFVDELGKLALSHRIAVVAFGDLTVPGDDIATFGFTDDVERVKTTLKKVPRYGGGSNAGESSLEAMDKALALPFRPNVVKAVVLITDEPALQHQFSAADITQRLAHGEILTFVVSPPKDYFRQMARHTGGTWYKVAADADFTGLLDLFRSIAVRLSTVVSDVYRLGDGSVNKYLQLKAPEK